MASLSKAIEFQHLANQLSNVEFEIFLFDLIESMGRQFILSAFFNKFTATNTANRIQQNEMDFVIKLILYIIKTRNKESVSSLDLLTNDDTMRLDQYSSAMIGEIASFLECCDYATFQRCSRLIYIGCNMPNTLRALDLTKYDCARIDLQRYSFLRTLSFPLDKFYKIRSISTTTLSHMESLTLTASFSDDIDGDVILLCLSKCPHLKALKLSDVYVRNDKFDESASHSVALPEGIQSLSMHGNGAFFGNFHSFLIQLCGNTLMELSFDDGFDLPNAVRFPDLKSLQMGIDVDLNQMENMKKIFKYAPNLERFVCDVNDTQNFDYVQMLQAILCKKSLKEMVIGTFEIGEFCDALSDVLIGCEEVYEDSDDEVMHSMPTSISGELERKGKSNKLPEINIVYKRNKAESQNSDWNEYELKLRLGVVKILKIMNRLNKHSTITIHWDTLYKACFDSFQKTFAEYLNDTRFSYNYQCLSMHK